MTREPIAKVRIVDTETGEDVSSRYVTDEPLDPRERFGLYRLCDCPTCEGKGKVETSPGIHEGRVSWRESHRCPDCRGEGRVRQEVASCESPEAVGVALVTLAREGEWEECPFGLLDRMPECDHCDGSGEVLEPADDPNPSYMIVCQNCTGSGVKPTGTWLILPWLPSPRNASDAGKLLRSRRST